MREKQFNHGRESVQYLRLRGERLCLGGREVKKITSINQDGPMPTLLSNTAANTGSSAAHSAPRAIHSEGHTGRKMAADDGRSTAVTGEGTREDDTSRFIIVGSESSV